jgi:ATP-dependent RNA helicase RhlE
MRMLTLTVDDDLDQWLRARAAANGTNVRQVLIDLAEAERAAVRAVAQSAPVDLAAVGPTDHAPAAPAPEAPGEAPAFATAVPPGPALLPADPPADPPVDPPAAVEATSAPVPLGDDESSEGDDSGDGEGPRRRRRRRRGQPSPANHVPAVTTASSGGPAEVAATAAAVRTAAIHGQVIDDADGDEELARFDVRAIPQHPVETVGGGFAELGLSASLVERLTEIGFLHPTPIQAAVIPPALAGRDVVGLAETGSGKTAAFVLPLAEHIRHGRGVRALIIAPTRELAMQTHAFLDILGRDRELTAVSLVGGLPLGPQIDRLRKNPDIVVATPGRLVDHLERGNVRLDAVERLVLDEADHMLDMGFLPQVQRILTELPAARQTLLFSATMPPPIERLANIFLNDPVKVDITPVGRTAAGISHRLYLVGPEDKKACLLALLHQELGSTLVFIRRRSDAEWLSKVLDREGLEVARIHSDLTQAQRLAALAGFRDGTHRILVATDVASRGIDVPSIRHVINFDLPDNVEDYVHRAGRTARGSALGIVSSICTMLDKPMIGELEHALGTPLPRCTVPGVDAYVESQRRPTIRRRRLL